MQFVKVGVVGERLFNIISKKRNVKILSLRLTSRRRKTLKLHLYIYTL